MSRKISLCLALVFTIAITLAFSAKASAAKSYAAESFDVNLDIQNDGSLWVTETVAFRFEGGPFTYVFRDLSTNNTDGISKISASMDQQLLPEGDSSGQVEIERANRIKVTWHFAPSSDSTHIFTLKYLVMGTIRKGDVDTLIWRSVPESHDYLIENSTITISYPARAVLSGQLELSQPFTLLMQNDQSTTLKVNGIPKDTPLDLSIHFQSGTINSPAPNWQAVSAHRGTLYWQAMPVALIALLSILIFGILVLVTWNHAHQRQRPFPAYHDIRPVSPPGPQPPAVASVLVHSNQGTSKGRPLATLFDLAQKGVVRIEQREKKMLWTKQPEFFIIRQPYPAALLPHESGLLSILFDQGKEQRDAVSFSEFGNSLSRHLRRFTEPLKEELKSAGYYDPLREKQRAWLLAISTIAILLGGIPFGLGLSWTSFASDSLATTSLVIPFTLTAIALGLFCLGLVGLIYASSRSTLTDQAADLGDQWRGFSEYLADVTRVKENLTRPDFFDLYLPYAAAFDLVEAWGKYFDKQGTAQVPAWFRPLTASAGQDDFGSFVAMLGASNASAGGDGGAGAAGAAGASGGGASGAG